MPGLPPDELLFGTSETMAAVQTVARAMASTSIPLMIRGEVGTGKETLARYIHSLSPWSHRPFVKIAGEVGETEAMRPAFWLRGGNGTCHGTLYLDEVADLSPDMQAKLLRLLSKLSSSLKEISRPHGLRLISATGSRLKHETEAGHFRPDLLCWIGAVSLELPPLRQRRHDILPMCRYFLRVFQDLRPGMSTPSLAVCKMLESYNWPGNVRELANMMLRYTVLGSEDALVDALHHARHAGTTLPDPPIEGVRKWPL